MKTDVYPSESAVICMNLIILYNKDNIQKFPYVNDTEIPERAEIWRAMNTYSELSYKNLDKNLKIIIFIYAFTTI